MAISPRCRALHKDHHLNQVEFEILVYLYEYTMRYAYQPSLREISTHMGWASASAVKPHLDEMTRKRWIEYRAAGSWTSRCIKINRRPDGKKFYGFDHKE